MKRFGTNMVKTLQKSVFLQVLLVAVFYLMMAPSTAFGQTPGQIFKPAEGDGRLILNPSGSGFVSASIDGYDPENIDYGTANEIGYHPLPLLFEETDGDQRTGGAHTDMYGVKDGSYGDPGAFVFNDGDNMLFRIRLIDFSTAAKGYSILFDINSDGVPDWEITLKTGGGQAGVQIYDAAGNAQLADELPLDEHFQRALAGVHAPGQTYYYDWYVNWDDMPFGPNDTFRAAAVTITSASGSYLSGGTVGDIGGVTDEDFSSEPQAVFTILEAMPESSGDNLEEGGGFGNVLSARPTVFAPISEDDTSISGTSTEADGTEITLNIYDDSEVFQTSFITAVSDNTWTVNDSGLTEELEAGYFVGATANATDKDASNESTRREIVAAGGDGGAAVCTPVPTAFDRASQNAATGTVQGLPDVESQVDLIIRFYSVNEDGSVGGLTISTNSDEANSEDVDLASYEGSGQIEAFDQDDDTGDVDFRLEAQGAFPSGTSFYITAQLDGECESDFAFDGDAVTVEAPEITTFQLEAIGSQTIEGTSTEDDGTEIKVFKNDDDTEIGSTIVTGGTWSATISAVDDGDEVYARAISDEDIRSARSNVVIVGIEESDEPTITMPSAGAYENENQEITGFSSEDPGTEITIYSHPGEDILGTDTVDAFGNWTVELDDPLSGGDQFKATANAFGKSESEFTDIVTVASTGQIPGAPEINNGNDVTAGSTSIPVSGSGTITLFADGVEIGSGSGSSITVDGDEIMVGVVLTATDTDNGFTSELSDPVSVVPAEPSSVSMFSNPANTVAGNSSQVVSTVQDEFGNVLEDIEVDFSIISGGGNFTGSFTEMTTNFLGQTSVSYETVTTIETATIGSELSSDETINDDTDVTSVAGPATEISSISLASGTIQANGSTTVTVNVLDANGNPVPDVNVSFSSDDTGIATVDTAVETDENGEATAAITAEGQAGDVQVTASINDGNENVDVSDSESISVTVTPVISAESSGVTVNPASVIANGVSTSTITINVQDLADDPVTGLGEEAFALVFDIAGTESATAAFSGFSDADEANGNYTFNLANSSVETGNVIVDVDGTELDDQPQVEFTEPVANAAFSSVDVDENTLIADGDDAVTMTITVKDGDEIGIAGLEFDDFDFSGQENAEINEGSFSNAGGGEYTVTVTSTTAEDIDITVEQNDTELGSTGTINVVPGPATRIALTGDTDDLTSGDSRTLTATLYDAEDNVVVSGGDSDLTVTFAKDRGEGTVDNLGDVTAANGVGTISLEAVLAGDITLTAEAENTGGATISDDIEFTIIASETVDEIVLTGNEDNLPSGETRTFTATIQDAAGNTVVAGPGSIADVELNQTGDGTLEVATATAVDGVAELVATGNQAGNVSVEAESTIDGVTQTSTPLELEVVTGAVVVGNSSISADRTEEVLADGNDVSVITITIRDYGNNLLEGENVFFEITGGSEGVLSAGPWTTNSEGEATAQLTAEAANTIDVTGYIGENSAGDEIEIVEVEFDPVPVIVDGVITDGVAGGILADVTVVAESGEDTYETQTDDDGSYSIELFDGVSYTISATTNNPGIEITDSVDITTDGDGTEDLELWPILDGEGSSESPFEISHSYELQTVIRDLDAHYIITGGRHWE